MTTFVVRECQEVVELSLKALVRSAGIEVPRVHDVGDILLAHPERFPPGIRDKLKRLSGISRALRRDRELAFYSSEDLTPSEFYREADARKARRDARWVFETGQSRSVTPSPDGLWMPPRGAAPVGRSGKNSSRTPGQPIPLTCSISGIRPA